MMLIEKKFWAQFFPLKFYCERPNIMNQSKTSFIMENVFIITSISQTVWKNCLKFSNAILADFIAAAAHQETIGRIDSFSMVTFAQHNGLKSLIAGYLCSTSMIY